MVLVYLRMRGIPGALGCSAYLSVWREVGALCGERLAVLVPSLPTLCFPLCISVTGFCSSRGRGGSWLGCQVLPVIGAVSILELAANSGSSRMFQAPNLQRATMLFMKVIVSSKKPIMREKTRLQPVTVISFCFHVAFDVKIKSVFTVFGFAL